MTRRGRRRGLTEDDRALWERVARTAEPLHPRREMGSAPPPRTSTAIPPRPDAPPPVPAAQPKLRAGARASDRRPAVDLARPVAEEVSATPLRMDAKRHKRMTSGKLSPEAKLDLHGLTLDEAHPRLAAFVTRARTRGLRLLLVVTGKGRRHRDDDGPIPRRPGALRHQVPIWLGRPPLGPHVLQVRPAHRRHGGEGAYYVYLRG